ncbi:MAG: DUF389 domain-containing protein, partial [Vicinamibacteria bacterium]
MTDIAPSSLGAATRLAHSLLSRFSLDADRADDESIDRRLRDGAELRGANLWVLIFAVMVASVGLNVNSTAVIIGAMLISPLMSPIMAVGYGAAIYDVPLVVRAVRDLLLASVFSVMASAAYFSLSPLSEPGSELLARTSPTLWDVLIALFGGLAGIVAATRKTKTNVIPGVAIATALMPPLCTAGYAIANARWSFFLGATYLFSINSVFIASATFVFVRLFNPTHVHAVDRATQSRIVRTVGLAVVVTMIPSLYLAYRLVQQEVFRARARAMVEREFSSGAARVVERRLDPLTRTVEITLVGSDVGPTRLAEVEARLPGYGLDRSRLIVHQSSAPIVDTTELKAGIVADLYGRTQTEVAQRDEKIRGLEADRARLLGERTLWTGVAGEMRAQYPEIKSLSVTQGVEWQGGADLTPKDVLIVNLHTSRRLTAGEKKRMEDWLRVRSGKEAVRI